MTWPPPADSFEWRREEWGTALSCGALAEVAPHLFTTRAPVLDKAGRSEGWLTVARAIGVPRDHLVRLRQVHGAHAVVVAERPPDDPPVADVVVTKRPDVALVVQVADCVPLLLADRRGGAVAAAHAGWRGVVAGAPHAAVRALAREFGSRPADLVAAIGPSIGPCCYEVGGDVREAFRRAGFGAEALACWFVTGRRDRPHLDLWRATRDALIEAGVPADRVHACGLCTVTHRDVFYSYRGDGAGTGRMVGVIRPRGV